MEATRLVAVEQELKTRLHQQEILTEIGRLALTTSSLVALFEQTAEWVAETLDVEFSEILELPPKEVELHLTAGVGWREGYVGYAQVGTESESQAGYTLLQNEPVVVSDLSKETRFSAPALLEEHKVKSGMTVVIPAFPRPFGVLGAHSTMARDFTSVEANFLQAVANLLASAAHRLKVETNLRTSRDELQVVLQGVADGITVQDASGKLVYANDAAARILGYPSAKELIEVPLEEMVGRYEIFDQEGDPFPLENLPGRKALQGEGRNSATIRSRLKETGEERWSEVKATHILGRDGQPKLAVNIFQDITELKRREQNQRLLAEASELITSSLDYTTTLQSVAQMVVPVLADWCSLHIVGEDEGVEQLAVAHTDPDKVALALDLNQKYPPDPNSPDGVYQVIRKGNVALFPEVTENLIEAVAQDGEHYRILRQLGMQSAMILPLAVRGQTLGALTLIWSESGRRYDQTDLELARELSRRAAIAIDNARLFQRAQQLNEELEARVTKRTRQLQSMINSLRNEIVERQKAEEALRESETMLENLFASAPDATILVDEGGKIMRINQQVQALFGYKPNELLGKTVEKLLPVRFQGAHISHRAKFMAEPRLRTMGANLELSARRKDGSEFPVDILLSPLETEHGTMVISAVRDISESKQMQAELAELQRHLFDQVDIERRKLAQELHDGPIQDAYGIIYQLKALTSNKDYELQEVIQAQIAAAAAEAQKVVQVLRAMCGELIPPTLAPYGLERAIQEHASNFQKAHPDTRVHLNLMEDSQLLPENVRFVLFRVYQNAVSNVMRHAQAENLKVEFKIDEDSAMLKIEDDGRGFDLPSRWVEFARQGHLGLVGSVERVKAIGGRFGIQSTPGKGTLIQVRIPLSAGSPIPGNISELNTGA